MRHAYQIIVSPSTTDRKEVLNLRPGENWLTLERDPSDGVIRPRLAATLARDAAPSSIVVDESSKDAAARGAFCLCLQYHRGLLLVKDEATPPPTSREPGADHDRRAVAEKHARPWRAWYSLEPAPRDASEEGGGGVSNRSQLVPMEPRQAIWLQHEGRLMLRQGGVGSSSAAATTAPRLHESQGGGIGDDDTTATANDSQETTPGNVSPPHLVWLEFRCRDEPGREAANEAVQAAAEWEEPTTAATEVNASSPSPPSSSAPAVLPPCGTDSDSLLRDASKAGKVPVVADDGTVANKATSALQGPSLSSPPRPGPCGTPRRSAAPSSHPPASFVYTAETQTTPPPPPPPPTSRRRNDSRTIGSPNLHAEAAPVSATEQQDENAVSSEPAKADVPSSSSDANPDQNENLSHPESQALDADTEPPSRPLVMEAERECVEGEELVGKNQDDVAMNDAGENQSQGDTAISTPKPPPVPPVPQPSILCSPGDDLLTQPPDRDDKTGPPVAEAADSQAQESQVVAAAAASNSLATINEAETGEVGNNPDDDDDATVDPDDVPGSYRHVSVVPPDLPRESIPIAGVATCAQLPVGPATPTPQNDTDGPPPRRPHEYSPTASDLESPSLRTPPSAASTSRRKRAPPPSEASPQVLGIIADHPTDPGVTSMVGILNGSPMQGQQDQACVSTTNPSEKADDNDCREDASPPIPVDESAKNTESMNIPTNDDDENGKTDDPGERGTVAEQDGSLSNESPSTPQANMDGAGSRYSARTNEGGLPAPLSPETLTRQEATASKADNMRTPQPRTPAARATRQTVDDTSVRRSTRKRSPSANESSPLTPPQRAQPPRKKAKGVEENCTSAHFEVQAEENVQPRRTGGAASCYVLVTSFDDSMSQKIANMVKQIGGVTIEELKDAHKCTHLVASDGKTPIKRTPKLMIALCVTANIVTLKWLQDSVATGKVRDAKPYLVLKDKEAETMYSFSMAETLQRIKERQKKRGTLLQGRKVFVCPTVFKNTEDGKKSPPAADFQLIVGAAGGGWVEKAKDLNAASARELLVITNADAKLKKTQLKQKDVASALENGASSASLKSFLHAMMTQDIRSLEYSH